MITNDDPLPLKPILARDTIYLQNSPRAERHQYFYVAAVYMVNLGDMAGSPRGIYVP